MKRESDRMLGVFGKREMELAAIVIVDKGLLHRAITVADFPDDGSQPVSMYVTGFKWLVAKGYLVHVPPEPPTHFRVTDEFVEHVNRELS